MPLDGWDHLELWVGNAKQAAYWYEHALGFERTAYAGPETGVRDRASYVLEQGEIRLVLTSGVRADSEIVRLRGHARRRSEEHRAAGAGRGTRVSRVAVERGAQAGRRAAAGSRTSTAASSSPRSGPTARSSTPSSTAPSTPARTYPATSRCRRTAAGARASGLIAIDHVVGNVELGKMNHWVEFYEQVFGMTNIVHFGDDQIQTEYSALMSKVMADGAGKIKFPINEPAEGKRKSQIDEYLEFNEGPGVQHIALQSRSIVETIETLKGRGVLFLDTPGGLLRRGREPRRRDRRGLRGPEAAADPRRPRRGRLPAADLHEDGAGPADALLRGDRAARRDDVRRGQLQGAVRVDRARAGPARQPVTRFRVSGSPAGDIVALMGIGAILVIIGIVLLVTGHVIWDSSWRSSGSRSAASGAVAGTRRTTNLRA